MGIDTFMKNKEISKGGAVYKHSSTTLAPPDNGATPANTLK